MIAVKERLDTQEEDMATLKTDVIDMKEVMFESFTVKLFIPA